MYFLPSGSAHAVRSSLMITPLLSLSIQKPSFDFKTSVLVSSVLGSPAWVKALLTPQACHLYCTCLEHTCLLPRLKCPGWWLGPTHVCTSGTELEALSRVRVPGTGEMAQWAKHLPCKCENVSSDSPRLCDKLSMLERKFLVSLTTQLCQVIFFWTLSCESTYDVLLQTDA